MESRWAYAHFGTLAFDSDFNPKSRSSRPKLPLLSLRNPNPNSNLLAIRFLSVVRSFVRSFFRLVSPCAFLFLLFHPLSTLRGDSGSAKPLVPLHRRLP